MTGARLRRLLAAAVNRSGFAAAALVLAGAVNAQPVATPPGNAPASPPRPSDTLALFGMAGQGFHQQGQGYAEFGSVAVQAGRFVSNHFQVLLELHPVFLVSQPRTPPHGERETVPAAALDLGLRWFPGPARWKARPYLEVLEGPFYATRRVPARGSAFNFLTQAGGGVLLPLGEVWHPFVSLRWVHISNAGLGMHNPDWDFQTLLIGASRRFPR